MRKPQKRVKITLEYATPSYEAIRFGVFLNLHKNHFQKRLLCNNYVILTNCSNNNLLHDELHYYIIMAIKIYRLSVFESSGVMKTMKF
jgi:hypothetical protein